jgi:hypothetical protein
MRRLLLFLCALFLLLDLSSDGGLGKVTFVAPQPAQAKVSGSHAKSAQGHFNIDFLLPQAGSLPLPSLSWPTAPVAVPGLTLSCCYYLGSAGGIPL